MNQPDPNQLFHDLLARCAESGASDLHLSADEIQRVHLASLHGEFCTVTTAGAVLQELHATAD